MIFTPRSKKVTPFSSLKRKIQAYQDYMKSAMVLPWNNCNTFHFSAPPMTQNNPRKRVSGNIRARWSNESRYNPMKTKRPNTPEMTMTKLDNIDIDKKTLLPVKICDSYGLSCLFCKQGTPHPLPQESD